MISPTKNPGVRAGGSALTRAAAGLLAFTALVLAVPDWGEAFNRALFLEPLMVARARTGGAPALSPKLGLVVLDDRSLARLQRRPTFAEWRGIADTLAAAGVRTVLLLDAPSIEGEVGTITGSGPHGTLIAPAVAVSRAGSRAMPVGDVPSRLFLRARGDAAAGSSFLVAPHPLVMTAIDGLGDVSAPAGHRVPAAVPLANGLILPSMGLRAAPALRAEGDRLLSGDTVLPRSPDGTIYIDYPDFEATLARALPASDFFDSDARAMRPTLGDTARERLRGVDVVLLAPNGQSGGRFVDGPTRKLPTYMVEVAVANAALAGRFVYAPAPFWLFTAAFAVAFAASLLAASSRRAVAAGAVATGAFVAAALAGFFAFGWVLPAAHAVALFALSGLMIGARQSFTAVRRRLFLERDLELGQAVQSMLMPQCKSGRVGSWEYRISFRPYGPMSGDWYQVFASPPEAAAPVAVFAVGDVVGKGPSAALITAAIATIWHEHSLRWRSGPVDLAALCVRLNDAVCNLFRGQQNSTLSLIVLADDEVAMLSGGAPPWLGIDLAAMTVSSHGRAGLNPLGMVALLQTIPVKTVAAGSVDVLLAVTDGVFDGATSRNAFRRLLASSGASPATPTPALFDMIEAAAIAAGAADVLPDDATLLLIRRVA